MGGFRSLPGEEDEGIVKKTLIERCCIFVLDVTYGAVVGKIEQTLSWLLQGRLN